MEIKSLDKHISEIQGKVVFLRVDFNVPLEKGGIGEERKIIATLPTIRFLLRYNCKIVIATHLGRPGGKVNKKFSTRVLANRLNQLLKDGEEKNLVDFSSQITGEKVLKKIKKIFEKSEKRIVFLENLRFNKGEKENSRIFAKKLAKLGQVYINEAFSVSHRNHASVGAIKDYLPSFAGFLLKKEIENLGFLKNPRKPLITIMGGVKVKTKDDLIQALLPRSEKVLLGGALANSFLAGQNYQVGKSLIEEESLDLARKYFKKYPEKILLPLDAVVTTQKDGSGVAKVKKITEIGEKDYIYDIGPDTVRAYSKQIRRAQTLIWNGPLGWFEKKSFNQGSLILARLIAQKSRGQVFGVAGGGETVEVLKESGMIDYLDWVSTGGGAMLTFLGGGKMPGLKGLVR